MCVCNVSSCKISTSMQDYKEIRVILFYNYVLLSKQCAPSYGKRTSKRALHLKGQN